MLYVTNMLKFLELRYRFKVVVEPCILVNETFFLSFHSASLLLREWERNIAKRQMSGANPKGIHHHTKHTRTPGKNQTLTFYVDEVRKSH